MLNSTLTIMLRSYTNFLLIHNLEKFILSLFYFQSTNDRESQKKGIKKPNKSLQSIIEICLQ